MSGDAQDVVAELKRHDAAVALKVVLVDGTEKSVPVPKNRNRWSRVQQVLDAMNWVRIEALDKSGGVLGVVDVESEELDEVEESGVDDGTVRIARLFVEVQRNTMKEMRLAFEVQSRGMASLVDAMVAGVHSMQESFNMALQVQRAHAVADAASGAAGSNPEMMALFQLALAQLGQQKPAKLTP